MFTDEPDLERLRKAYELRKTNAEMATAEFEALAKLGSTMSHVYLGEAFEYGIGAKRDLSRSEDQYIKAFDMGYVLGLFRFASRHFKEHNDVKAEALYRKCVEKDYLPSIYWLARLYLRHQKDDRANIKKAIDLLKVAASRGHVFGKRDLAVLMIKGHLGFKDRFKGMALYLATAKNGVLTILKNSESETLK